ncbi:histone deacetylase [Leptospira sp. WS58.C1]|uniref:histone deacetylase family protein n=1 Tax=Leptospira TaxID=171 RepID=UPI0002BE09CF|nr:MULTISPECIES: histone deacetylase [unclassified Leptospira]EMJ97539.1 histone deacetylase family protein [Leptospira sp. B5-022]MCR1792867.1 histone deacetylase [Leptospira sp. id769339]
MKLGYAYDDTFLLHDTGTFHPESPQRLEAILDRLHKTSYFKDMQWIKPNKLPFELIESVHNQRHRERFSHIQGKRGSFDGDTPYSESSFDAAILAAGSGVDLVNKIRSDEIESGIALVRPPGHHAETGRSMGFCLLNNIAITATHLLAQGVEKVYILDWDVHHGNGTQEIFYESDKVYFTSLHQYPYYPGTGSAQERGKGRGQNFTLNIPLPMGSGDKEYLHYFQETVIPSLLEFQPEYVLISAGFDGHKRDPLAGMNLSTNAFAEFTRLVLSATKQIGAKTVSFLEGGYDLDALAESVEAHIAVLAG